jgi:hypothetical protein
VGQRIKQEVVTMQCPEQEGLKPSINLSYLDRAANLLQPRKGQLAENARQRLITVAREASDDAGYDVTVDDLIAAVEKRR